LVGGYEILYGQVKSYVQSRLFDGPAVDIDDPVVLRNLSETAAAARLHQVFKGAINALTVQETGSARIEDYIRLRDMRPFRTQYREWLPARRSLFNRIVGEPGAGGLELRFARFLDEAGDVAAFAKNYLALGFKLDYVKADRDLSTYTPDFIVKAADGNVLLVETKGREELDLPRKMARLAQWCEDATTASRAQGGPSYGFVYVDQEGFERHPPASLAELRTRFREYQPAA
jgi:type III restriction enzyme